MNYISENKKFWNRTYHAPNVEGFIFRLKPLILDEFINFKNKKKFEVLDYGCGEGTNVIYLSKKYGFNSFGVDISESSIKECKKKIKQNKNNFRLINVKPNIKDNFFKRKFDLIISIQTLYYYSNSDLNLRLESFRNMLKPNGYVYFSMISPKSVCYKFFSDKKKDKNGLSLISEEKNTSFKKRQKEKMKTLKHYVNFTKSEKDLKNKFKIFKPLKVGYYDLAIQSSHPSHHYTFFGKLK